MSKRVLFACVHNAGRSQMAAAFFDALADARAAGAESGGTRPAGQVQAEVVASMREVGIDLSAARPRPVPCGGHEPFDLLVTMGCGETCQAVRARERLDWPLADPQGQSPEAVRAIRDDIRRRVQDLVASRGWGRARRSERRAACR